MYKQGDVVVVKFFGRVVHGIVERQRPIEFQPFPGEVTYSINMPHLKYEANKTQIIKADEIIGNV